MIYCRYCGKRVKHKDTEWEGQFAHTQCVNQRPYDLIIKQGNCTLALHTELLSTRKLGYIIDIFERNTKE